MENIDYTYSFENLELYKEAREYRKKMYTLANKLPDIEKFNLAPQVRSSARSLTNNIAEGHGRYYFKENIQFLRISRGSLEELLDDLNICMDESYFEKDYVDQLKMERYELLKKINGYISYLRKRQNEPLSCDS